MTSLFLSDQPPVGLLGSISDRHVWQEVNSEDEFIGVKITHQTSLETTGSSTIMTFPNQGYGPNLEIRKPQVDFMTNGRDQKLCCR